MNPQSEIIHNMNFIRGIFMDALEFCRQEKDPEHLIRYAELQDKEFRSVAYESIAMELSLQDFASGDTGLANWHLFKERSSIHRVAQIHVGLGWAMAKLKLPVLRVIEKLDPLMRYRVVDGYAYYEGCFRTLQSINKQHVPEGLDDKVLDPYNQGLGRSLWYLCRGNAQDTAGMLADFSPERHASLWRGVGLAGAFVGGLDEKIARELLALAGEEYRIQLAAGAIMATQSRLHNRCLTPSALHCCRIWGNLSQNEVTKISNDENFPGSDAYFDWIRQIEEGINRHLQGAWA